MKAEHLLKNKRIDFLKVLARELLINERSEIDKIVLTISQTFKVPEEEVRGFINYLYRHGLLVKYERGTKYSLTLDGVSFLIDLAEKCYIFNDLEGGKNEPATD